MTLRLDNFEGLYLQQTLSVWTHQHLNFRLRACECQWRWHDCCAWVVCVHLFPVHPIQMDAHRMQEVERFHIVGLFLFGSQLRSEQTIAHTHTHTLTSLCHSNVLRLVYVMFLFPLSFNFVFGVLFPPAPPHLKNCSPRSLASSSATMTSASAPSSARPCSTSSSCCRCVPSSRSRCSNSPGGHCFATSPSTASYSSPLSCVSRIRQSFGELERRLQSLRA